MDLGLADRVCVVTGSTSGIGLVAAQMLAAEGAQVVVCGRDAERVELARAGAGAMLGVVCDLAEPAAPEAVVAHAASLLGLPAPLLVPFETAGLSPMARSFYDDNKRVRNALIKKELGVRLRYPNYRAGLAAILAAGG